MVLYTDINPYFFLLSLAPLGFIPALIGLGGSLLSSLMNRESATSKARTAAQTAESIQQTRVARAREGREAKLFTQSQGALGQILPELQALLSGDRTALTRRFAPALESLTRQRAGAEQRIRQSGPASGATVAAQAQLEQGQFSARSQLLASAPREAQAGLTQLLQLLLGGAAQQGAGATAASSLAGSLNADILANEQKSRFLNADILTGISKAAAGFGKSFFNDDDDTGGSGVFRLGFEGDTSSPSTRSITRSARLEQLVKGGGGNI